MPCVTPYTLRDPETGLRQHVGCGKCEGCVGRRTLGWVGRMRLEAREYGSVPGTFRTLTYAEEPSFQGNKGILDPKDLTDYLKRLRKHTGPFRFFACGEYGKRTFRGHWHIILFGRKPEFPSMLGRMERDPQREGFIEDPAWKDRGLVYDGEVWPEALAYVAKYICDHPVVPRWVPNWYLRLPLSRMSRMPGIGSAGLYRAGATFARENPKPEVLVTKLFLGPRKDDWYPITEGGAEMFKRGFVEAGGILPPPRDPFVLDMQVEEYNQTYLRTLGQWETDEWWKRREEKSNGYSAQARWERLGL